jgi:hypothetical protein
MSTKTTRSRWLRRRSAREILLRLRQATAVIRERSGPYGRGTEPSDAELLAALPGVQSSDGGAWTSLRAQFADPARRVALPGWREPAVTAQQVRADFPDEVARLVPLAEAAMEGRLSLLGAGELSVGQPVRWHCDPLSGKFAPMVHWSRIPHLDAERVGDHKFTWEVNRHRQLVLLSQAFQLTGDRRFAVAHSSKLAGWIDANPPKLGINWGSSLEIAFRSVSWCWSLHLLRQDDVLSGALLARALKVLVLNGRHIEAHLSTYYAPNTHLTGEALGLLYLGLAFPELREAPRWRTLGWETLRTELDRQVYGDGTYYEQSTYYQRYVADFCLHAAILGREAGLAGADGVLATAERVCDVLDAIVRPDGSIPLLGDDDGGTLLSLTSLRPDDIRPTLALAAAALNRPALAPATAAGLAEATWVLGRAVRPANLPAPRPPARIFPDGGLVVMRQGRGNLDQLVFDAGPHGARRTRAVHSHADALAIDVTVAGTPILVDPGTYTYVGDPIERDRMRRSSSHNTLTLGAHSSSDPAGPFGWKRTTDATLDTWCSDAVFAYARASHAGLRPSPPSIMHTREVLQLSSLGWLVRDRVVGATDDSAILHFHADSGCDIEQVADGTLVWHGESGLQLALAGTARAAREDGWVSRLYGERRRAPVLVASLLASPRRDAVTLLCPLRRGEAPAVVQADRTQEGWRLKIGARGNSWTVEFGPGLAKDEAHDAAALVRFEHRADPSHLAVTRGLISTSDVGHRDARGGHVTGHWVIDVMEQGETSQREGMVMRTSQGD